MAVDVLFQHAEPVPEHDDLVEKGLDGDLLGLEALFSRTEFHDAPLPFVTEVDGFRRLHVLVKDVFYGGDDVLEVDAAGRLRSRLHDLIGLIGLGQFFFAVFLEEDAPSGAGFPENRTLPVFGMRNACSYTNHVR